MFWGLPRPVLNIEAGVKLVGHSVCWLNGAALNRKIESVKSLWMRFGASVDPCMMPAESECLSLLNGDRL